MALRVTNSMVVNLVGQLVKWQLNLTALLAIQKRANYDHQQQLVDHTGFQVIIIPQWSHSLDSLLSLSSPKLSLTFLLKLNLSESHNVSKIFGYSRSKSNNKVTVYHNQSEGIFVVVGFSS